MLVGYLRYLTIAVVFLFLQGSVYGWNALGHRLVAQIAYDHLNEKAKFIFTEYNRQLDKLYRPTSLVNAAPWMDKLRYQKDLWLKSWHYIDIPFSWDQTALKPPGKRNALTGINRAVMALMNKQTTPFNKGFSLRILLHLVGDLHQPLHATSQFSAQHPEGDYGGNLVTLGKNSIAKNLHAYWDNGGGLLKVSRQPSTQQLKARASRIEKRWPCDFHTLSLDPVVWAKESHDLAVKKAYLIRKGQKPDKKYQRMVKNISQERIAIAGCRLGLLLNKLSEDMA